MKKPIVIGTSGVARSGKDLFCSILKKQLNEKFGLTVTQMALANELKKDCENFLKEKCEMDVWTQDTELKTSFRDLLVWYGNIKRQKTKGRYWVEKLTNSIRESTEDVIIVSDIRYAHYDIDEVQWLKNEMGGVLVHISKFQWMYSKENGDLTKVFTPPPNEQERINDPKVRAMADYNFEWEDRVHDGVSDLLHDDYLNKVVERFVSYLPTSRIGEMIKSKMS